MASSSSNPLKRFGFKRTNTAGEVPTTTDYNGKVTSVPTATELTDMDESGAPRAASVSKIAGEFNGQVKTDHGDAVHNISEIEANRRLNKFRADHTWDPNMPDSAWDAINDVTANHDQKGEAILVDELVEDSPYPEVSRQIPLPCKGTDLNC